MLDDLQQDLVQPLDDVGLDFAQGHLVGNLEDIAQRLGAFAVKAAHGQAQLVDGLNDLVDLLGQDQPGQMQHGADADAGAEIGRAGGQITQVRAESVIEFALQFGIHLVDGHPGLPSCRPGRSACMRRWSSSLIITQSDSSLVEDQAAAGAFGGVLAADEMPLDQNLFVQRGQDCPSSRKRRPSFAANFPPPDG